MARRRKSRKIEEAMTFPNVFQPHADTKGKWQEYFGNDRPITLELGCGTGAYTLALARMFPEQNFIGVDIKGARIWTGAKQALEEKLANVAWLRIPIETLTDYFAPGEVKEIWITFPDPYPRKKQAKRRLTAPRFLAIYKEVIQPHGVIHVKTDDEALWDYTIETVAENGGKVTRMLKNMHAQLLTDCPELAIETRYEERHREAGKQIHYASFHFSF